MHIKVDKTMFCKCITFTRLILYLILSMFFIFSIIFILYFYINNKSNNSKTVYSNNIFIQSSNSDNSLNNNEDKTSKIQENSYNLYDNVNSFLTIPVLNIFNAPIRDGTSQSVMKNYIGHFSNTSYDEGNIGLASHNRGDGATYFKDLYKLKHGDYILYTYKNITRKYVVSKIITIDSYDWSYLENTTENKLTLITCINDKPNFRLCVQAIQI